MSEDISTPASGSTSAVPSALLRLPGAVSGEGIDAPVAAHYGSFNLEQRALEAGDGFVDLSHRGVVRITGPDRLEWLHSLTTQYLTGLAPGRPTVTLVLSPQGHVEHALYGVDDGEAFTAHVEPGAAPALVDWLDRMRFMMRVEVTDITPELAVAWRPLAVDVDPARAGRYDLVPRDRLMAYAEAAGPAAGLWAFEALRIARGEPRIGIDTDHRTIPNEVGWISEAPWGAVHLDGSANQLPEPRTPLVHDGREVGFVGSSARHHELGPIALGLVKRAVPLDATLDAAGLPAAQEVVVDPEVGLHARPRLA